MDTYDCSTETLLNGSRDLFPNKLLNLEGGELKLTLLTYQPYTVWTVTVKWFSYIFIVSESC